MKRLLLLLILISSRSFAQGNEHAPPQDTLYFNAFYETARPEHAEIVRVIAGIDPASNGYLFKEFDKNGRLEKSGTIKEVSGRPNGHIAYYHKNGIKQSEGYLDIRKKGLWKEWYQNGQLKEEVEYSTGEKGALQLKMITYFDSVGNKLVDKGEGLFQEYYQNDVNGQLKTRGTYKNHHRIGQWEGYHKNGALFYKESYGEDGEFIRGLSYDLDGNRYDYREQEVQPFPAEGMGQLYRFISRKLKYPKVASKNGIQGRVFVQFVVDKDGSILDVEVVKGISKECDEEAERVIKLMKAWTPGYQRGQAVKVRMILPLLFKLP